MKQTIKRKCITISIDERIISLIEKQSADGRNAFQLRLVVDGKKRFVSKSEAFEYYIKKGMEIDNTVLGGTT